MRLMITMEKYRVYEIANNKHNHNQSIILLTTKSLYRLMSHTWIHIQITSQIKQYNIEEIYTRYNTYTHEKRNINLKQKQNNKIEQKLQACHYK